MFFPVLRGDIGRDRCAPNCQHHQSFQWFSSVVLRRAPPLIGRINGRIGERPLCANSEHSARDRGALACVHYGQLLKMV